MHCHHLLAQAHWALCNTHFQWLVLRNSLLHWLQDDWRKSGPCVCCLQGFSGVGKSYTADLLLTSGAFKRTSLVEIPEGRTSFEDALLLVNESLDRDLDTRLVMGGDMASELEKVLAAPVLLVIDEFQNCLEPDGSPLPGFAELFNNLRVSRQHGRVLLLSSRAVDEDKWERISIRTIGGLTTSEGVNVLAKMLLEADLESEVPEELVSDVVSWLGGNPRALRTLVASLRHFPLEELIELDPVVWEQRNNRMSPQMILRLERRFVRKTYATVSSEGHRAVRRLSVHRRSFKYEAVEAAMGPGSARIVVFELIDNFLLERRRNWYYLNPIIRELASAALAEGRTEYLSSHRAAADYYARPFRARRATASRNAANFIEARHHLMATDDLGKFTDIARLYALHLQRIFNRRTPVPANREELSNQIATLDAGLTGGSPSSDLHYYLAKLFLARNVQDDWIRALEELKEAISLPRCPAEAWVLLIQLGEFEAARSALDDDSTVSISLSRRIYLELARALAAADRRDDAIDLLREGITRLRPEHNVVSLYEDAAKLLAAADRRDDAIDLLREGITRLGPEHNVFSLYQDAAELLAAADRRDDAIDLLREGITRIGPEYHVVSLYEDAAKLLAGADRRDDAIDLLREGITRIGPEHSVVTLYEDAAKLLAAADRRDDAIDLLREGITRIGPEHNVFSLYLDAAELLAGADRRDDAIDLLREGITRIGPEHSVVSLYEDAAKLLAGADRRDDAIDLLREGITRLRPEHNVVSLYQDAAELLAGADRRDDAIDLLREGITRIGPEHNVVSLYEDAAKLLAGADRRDDAIDLLREGITRIGPAHNVFSLYQDAAELLAAADRRDDAIDLLREGITRIGPAHNVFSLYQDAAKLLAAADRRDDAIDLLREGITRIGPGHSVFSLYQDAAKLLAAADRRDDAIDLLREGITRIGSGHSVVSLYEDAAKLLAGADRRDDAIDLLREGITRLRPEHNVFSLYQDAAELLAGADRRDDAIDLLREGITRIGPEHNVVSLYEDAAELLAAADRRDEAIAILDQGIDRYGNNSVVGSLLSRKSQIIALSGDYASALNVLLDGVSYVKDRRLSKRLAEYALFTAYGLQDEVVLREIADRLAALTVVSPDIRSLARVLLLQLQNDWLGAAMVPTNQGDFSYSPILCQQAFSALCGGDSHLADVILAQLQVRPTRSIIVSWVNALVANAHGDSVASRRHLEDFFGRPLTIDEQGDTLLWVRVWNRTTGDFSFRLTFYFPRLPVTLTGFPFDVTSSNIAKVLHDVNRQDP